MIALGIRYLTGNVVASNAARRPEWPPHPGRVFMAMAAAYFETGEDSQERAALEWLEQQKPAPAIAASGAELRSPVETYVPVNDKHGGIIGRSRQARSFATARPYRDSVFLVWHSEAPADVREGLSRLCTKVTRIGHSSSLVQMWVAGERDHVTANWHPDESHAQQRMRVAEAGTLAQLKEQGEDSDPKLSRWQGYTTAESVEGQKVIAGPFDSRLIVLAKLEGPVLGLESTLQLTGALRNAAMKALPDGEVPEWLSGHQADGTPTLKPHVAFFPLPFVGADYADGHVMGLAMAIPRNLPQEELKRTVGALLFHESGEEKQIRLWRARRNGDQDSKELAWSWQLARETRERPPIALGARTWTEPKRVWASVTPIVLHHYPKKNRDGDLERILREAFESAGLPLPTVIRTAPVSVFAGAGHARSMPEFAEGGADMCRYQTHAVVEFEDAVQGPVLAGRGRFRGYGLFRPVRESGSEG